MSDDAPSHPAVSDTSGPSDRPATLERFDGADLRGARFTESDLSGAVMRGVVVTGLEIDSPWILEDGGPLLVNGVDVTAFVDAELDRRFPGRGLRTASDPAGLQEAWAALERTWADTLARAERLPTGAVDEQVDGEWSFAQTLRHLVMATDTWLRRAAQELPEPYHPIGLPDSSYASEGGDPSIFTTDVPAWAEVLAVRAERVAMVREFLAGVTAEELEGMRHHPWRPAGTPPTETVLRCLHTVLEEEWEHHRYAVRDLAVIEGRLAAG